MAKEPRIDRFRGGWAASGDGFATFAATKEEAIRQFRMHMPDSFTSADDDEEAGALLDGLGLALTHHGVCRSSEPPQREAHHVDLVRGPAEIESRR